MEEREIMNPRYISCENHYFKKAKKFCNYQDCKKFICNSCALEDHSNHLDNLQNIEKFYKKESVSLENFNLKNNLESLENPPTFTFKCIINVYHQAKFYCTDCKDFICQKCSVNHEQSHVILSNFELVENLNEKLDIIKSFFNKEKYFMDGMNEESNLIRISKESLLILEEKLLKDAFDLKFKFESFLNLMKKLKFMLLEKLWKTFSSKNNLLFSLKFDLSKFASFLDTYKFEKDKNKFFGTLIKWEGLINSILKDNEVTEIKRLINFNSQIKILNDEILFKFENLMSNFSNEIENFSVKYFQDLDNSKTFYINKFKDIIEKESGIDKEPFFNILNSNENYLNSFFDSNILVKNIVNQNNNNPRIIEINTNKTEQISSSNSQEEMKFLTKEISIEQKNIDSLKVEFYKMYLQEFQSKIDFIKTETITIYGQEKTQIPENQDITNDFSVDFKNLEIKEIEVIKYLKQKSFPLENLHIDNVSEFMIFTSEKEKNFSNNNIKSVKFDEFNEKKISELNFEDIILERNLSKADVSEKNSLSNYDAKNENNEKEFSDHQYNSEEKQVNENNENFCKIDSFNLNADKLEIENKSSIKNSNNFEEIDIQIHSETNKDKQEILIDNENLTLSQKFDENSVINQPNIKNNELNEIKQDIENQDMKNDKLEISKSINQFLFL